MSRADSYFLTTARLGFGYWSMSDLPLAKALWGDLRVTRLIGGPFSAEQIEHKLRQEIDWRKTHRVQYWPLFLLSSDEHVGCGGLRPYKPEEQIYELGIHLRPAFWGQGLAVEAGRAIIGFAFDTMGVKSLFAGHHPENIESRRLLEKLGFHFTHEELYRPTGRMHPSYLLTS